MMPDRKKTLEEFDRITSALVDALILLQDQPDVVFCKDCKHLEHMYSLDDLNNKKCYVCKKHTFTGLRDPEWFCADGERKD